MIWELSVAFDAVDVINDVWCGNILLPLSTSELMICWFPPTILLFRWNKCDVDTATAAAAVDCWCNWMCCWCCWSDVAVQYDENGANDGVGPIADHVVVNWRHIVCHIDVKYGHEKLLPDNSISRIRVSIGVLPTKRTKNNCSITCRRRQTKRKNTEIMENGNTNAGNLSFRYFTLQRVFSSWNKGKVSCYVLTLTWDDTVRSDGKRNSNLPKRVGWFGYCVRQYSSKAHWDFSCSCSMFVTSDKPQASTIILFFFFHSEEKEMKYSIRNRGYIEKST